MDESGNLLFSQSILLKSAEVVGNLHVQTENFCKSNSCSDLEQFILNAGFLSKTHLITFTGQGGWTGGPGAVLAHHLSLGVAVTGVQAVGAALHPLARPHRGEAEDLTLVTRAQRLTQAPATISQSQNPQSRNKMNKIG